jgi:hypothetical protein
VKSGRSSTASTGDVWLKLATRQNMMLVTGAPSGYPAVAASQRCLSRHTGGSALWQLSANRQQLFCSALLPAAECRC